MFEIWTLEIWKMLNISDFRQILGSENQAVPVVQNRDAFQFYKPHKNLILSGFQTLGPLDFRQCLKSGRAVNRTQTCLKSGQVQI